MNTFDAWLIKTMEICKETMAKEAIAEIDNIDNELLGGMLMSGHAEKITPDEMAIRIQAVLDK